MRCFFRPEAADRQAPAQPLNRELTRVATVGQRSARGMATEIGQIMRIILLAIVLLTAWSGVATAQSIERACLRSDRDARSRVLCGCIQDAANLTLSARDQKTAATFYRDPQKAQDLRQSPNRASRRFWDRYKEYAEVARTFCG